MWKQCPHAAPQLLQGFVTGDQGGPYSNMFEGWQPAGVASSAQPAAGVQYTTGMVQSTFLQPPAGAPGEMHFPAGWHAQRQQVCASTCAPPHVRFSYISALQAACLLSFATSRQAGRQHGRPSCKDAANVHV